MSTEPVRLCQGDALDVGRILADERAQIVYLDPPFNVGTVFRARVEGGAGPSARASGPVAYVDNWASVDAYIEWLTPRLLAAWSIVSDTGTFWLHLDHRSVHQAKVACDRAFGPSTFLTEIVWSPGNGSKARNFFGITHQTLLVYTRARKPVFHASEPLAREPFASTSLAMHFTQADNHGRKYRDRIVNGKTYRYYADEGRALGSLWTDCPSMGANTPLRKETTGYATQKPLRLLERIVRTCSNESDLVVDPFCGSGTTLVAAAQAGRRALGCDVGDLAIATAAARLAAENIQFRRASVGEALPGAMI
jgi:site-specific DNA-methyltransferase (adenine-specific)